MKGISRRDLRRIYEELRLKAQLLETLAKRRIYDYFRIWRTIKRAYNVGVERLLEMIEGGGEPWESD